MSDHYNNDVTYSDKFTTKENVVALNKLQDKYFDRSGCSPSCPLSWAPEVLALLDYLDKEFGIARNDETLRGYYMRGKWWEHITYGPFTSAWKVFGEAFLPQKASTNDRYLTTWLATKSIPYRLKSIGKQFIHSYRYGMNCLRVQLVNPVVNKILKPKVTINQIKEKYGSFRLYYSAPDYLHEHIDNLIRKVEVQLAVKGVYYPVESLYYNNSSFHCDSEYHPTDYKIKSGAHNGKPYKELSIFTYRKPMKELGLDLAKVKSAADAPKKPKKKSKVKTKNR